LKCILVPRPSEGLGTRLLAVLKSGIKGLNLQEVVPKCKIARSGPFRKIMTTWFTRLFSSLEVWSGHETIYAYAYP